MYEQLLTQIGLTADQATIYELLLREGGLSAGKISQKTPLKRGITYKILEDLAKIGLVSKHEPAGKVATFSAIHPSELRDMLVKKEEKVTEEKKTLETLLPQLLSTYNLAVGKPGVEFYEGQAGVEKVARDSLHAKSEIYSYLDPEAIDQFLGQLNLDYKKQRATRGIKKKILVPDSPFTRQRYTRLDREVTAAVTEVRFMDKKIPAFQTVMQIYDNTVSYISLNKQTMIGVMIRDPIISAMHHSLFLFAWQASRSLDIHATPLGVAPLRPASGAATDKTSDPSGGSSHPSR